MTATVNVTPNVKVTPIPTNPPTPGNHLLCSYSIKLEIKTCYELKKQEVKSQQSLEIKYSHKPRTLCLSHQCQLGHPGCSHHNLLPSTVVLNALVMYSESFSVCCLNFVKN